MFSFCQLHSAVVSPFFYTSRQDIKLAIGSWQILNTLIPEQLCCCACRGIERLGPNASEVVPQIRKFLGRKIWPDDPNLRWQVVDPFRSCRGQTISFPQ